jgi:hypothetical protein
MDDSNINAAAAIDTATATATATSTDAGVGVEDGAGEIGSGHVAADEEEEECAVPTTPLVFLCVKCRNILGDSLAIVQTDEERQTITLSGVSNIKWSTSVSTAKNGFDVGNTYFTIACGQCEVQYS